jgi:hypothetical protein
VANVPFVDGKCGPLIYEIINASEKRETYIFLMVKTTSSAIKA